MSTIVLAGCTPQPLGNYLKALGVFRLVAEQADSELVRTHCVELLSDGISYEAIRRAAFVPRPTHVSGWDMAAGAPKPTSRMVARGAAYFVERADGKPFGESDALSLWLAAPGTRTDEGFGRVIPGVWRPAESRR